MLHTPFGDNSDGVTARNKANRIGRIQFGILSEQQVLAMSRVEITTEQTWQNPKSFAAGELQQSKADAAENGAGAFGGGGGGGGGGDILSALSGLETPPYNKNDTLGGGGGGAGGAGSAIMPVEGGLFSLEMGTLQSRGPLCETCKGNFETCPGHWGHIMLAKPVINICFVGLLMKVLRCVCVYCSSLLIAANNKHNHNPLDISIQQWHAQLAKGRNPAAMAALRLPVDSSAAATASAAVVGKKRKVREEEGKDEDDEEEEEENEKEEEEENEKEEEEEEEEEAEEEEEEENENEKVSAGGWKRFLQTLRVKKVCDHCGALQPQYKKKKRSDRDKVAGFEIHVRYPEYKNKGKHASMLSEAKRDILERQPRVNGKLQPEQILAILKRISDRDAKQLGFQPPYSHPASMVITAFPVPPPCIRPALTQDGIVKGEDDLTTKLVQIVKANRKLLSAGDVSTHYDTLQFHVNTYFNNDKSVAGSRQSLRQNGKPLKTIRARLRGKEGRMRGNLMGKRVKASARTVITPDANIAPDEVGVPYSMASRLTFTETVTSWNLPRLRLQLQRNRVLFVDSTHRGGVNTDVSYLSREQRLELSLQIGDSVEHSLQDGAEVIMNRQPSLWEKSMMGHRVQLMPFKTFRLNLAVCAAYNADFDGDEMNMHVPQSQQTRAEVSQLMMVGKHMIQHQSNKPVMGLVQDSLLAVHLMTMRNVFFTRAQFQQLVHAAFADEPWSDSDNNVPRSSKTSVGEGTKEQWRRALSTQPAILKPECLWTGKQLFSLLLPEDLSYNGFSSGRDDFVRQVEEEASKKNGGLLATFSDTVVQVVRGELLSGIIDKAHVGASSQSLNQILHNDYGSAAALRFIYQAQRMCGAYMSMRGFSVCPSDLEVTDSAHGRIATSIRHVIDETQRQVLKEKEKEKEREAPSLQQQQQHEVPPHVELTRRMQLLFQQVGVDVIKDTCYREQQEQQQQQQEKQKQQQQEKQKQHRRHDNQIQSMILSGSKGTTVNIIQMVGLVGPQSVQGRSIAPQLYGGRTLPTFPFTKQPELFASGFVEHPFCDGLTPSEFFFHAMGGREGLIDTAVKTSESGYIQRRLVKMMEDIQVQHDGSVRNSANRIVQCSYGGHGFRPFLEQQKLAFFQLLFSPASAQFRSLQSLAPFSTRRHVARLRAACELAKTSLKGEGGATENDADHDALMDALRDVERMLSAISPFKAVIHNSAHFPIPLARWVHTAFSAPLPISSSPSSSLSLGDENEVASFHAERMLWFFRRYGQQNLLFYCQLRAILKLADLRAMPGWSFQRYRDLWTRMEQRLERARIPAGEMVGTQVAQNFGQQVTQMVLNTFHLAGVGERRVTNGIPRMREIINIPKKPKNPSMTLHLRPPLCFDRERVTAFARHLECIFLHVMVKSSAVCSLYEILSPHVSATASNWASLPADLPFVSMLPPEFVRGHLFDDVLHLQLSTKKLKKYSMDPFEIRHRVENAFPGLVLVDLIAAGAGEALHHLWIGIEGPPSALWKRAAAPFSASSALDASPALDASLPPPPPPRAPFFDNTATTSTTTTSNSSSNSSRSEPHPKRAKISNAPGSSSYSSSSSTASPASAAAAEREEQKKRDEEQEAAYANKCRTAIKSLEQYLMKEMPCRGVSGINKTFVIKREELPLFLQLEAQAAEKREYYLIETEGSNLPMMALCEELDFSRSYCNSAFEANQSLGLEAARAVQFEELHAVMCSENPEAIYPSHAMLLVDVQTKDGRLMPITRHGMAGKMDEEPLNRASFEQTTEVLVELAGHGNVDNMLGVTDNIIMGQTTSIGTGKMDLLLDERRACQSGDEQLRLVFSAPFAAAAAAANQSYYSIHFGVCETGRLRCESGRVVDACPLAHWAQPALGWDRALAYAYPDSMLQARFSSCFLSASAPPSFGASTPLQFLPGEVEEYDPSAPLYDPENPSLFAAAATTGSREELEFNKRKEEEEEEEKREKDRQIHKDINTRRNEEAAEGLLQFLSRSVAGAPSSFPTISSTVSPVAPPAPYIPPQPFSFSPLFSGTTTKNDSVYPAAVAAGQHGDSSHSLNNKKKKNNIYFPPS
jgi:DNA-directed RNA polymerase beta' subunit